VKNNIPSHALHNKTHEMWNDRIPSVRHLKVFGSTYYDLIHKDKRNNIGASQNYMSSWGYPNTTKAYPLYNEVNKKFILSSDMIFLESTKDDKIVERQLTHLDKFIYVK
jgi:5-methylcytosine-specific restriction endonuclease McrA